MAAEPDPQRLLTALTTALRRFETRYLRAGSGELEILFLRLNPKGLCVDV
jgi:hypothetical protein